MKTVVQRVTQARVRVDGEIVGEIGVGLVALVGVEKGDTEADAVATAQKLAGLRVFRNPDDPRKPIDRSLGDLGGDVKGACLVISQFTIPGRLRKGRRPSFDRAESPERANALYTRVAEELRGLGIPTQTGRFAADMEVSLVNDGPVTLLLFSRDGQIVDAE